MLIVLIQQNLHIHFFHIKILHLFAILSLFNTHQFKHRIYSCTFYCWVVHIDEILLYYVNTRYFKTQCALRITEFKHQRGENCARWGGQVWREGLFTSLACWPTCCSVASSNRWSIYREPLSTSWIPQSADRWSTRPFNLQSPESTNHLPVCLTSERPTCIQISTRLVVKNIT